MRQILQNFSSGETALVDVPCPRVGRGQVLIETRASLVSVGTERMLVNFGKANLIDKARQQPEKVKQVLAKARTDGIKPTLEAVRSKLEQGIPLGYCNAGVVLEVGPDVPGLQTGDRVVSNGSHAEIVCVPHRLVAPIPDGVSFEDAAFTVLAAIGLQGIRLTEPTLGERVVVTGLGPIGLLVVQMLRASGCKVLGIDPSSQRCALAREFGAETVDLSAGQDPVAVAAEWSGGAGVDAVLLTLSTKSHDPIHQAAEMCRKRGRIVLVGVTGLQLNRADFYDKELSLQVSCSYGPGRYDPGYEQGGHDYPVGFVRWTEQRNFEAVLGLLADGSVKTSPLISHRRPMGDAPALYEEIASGADVLGAVLQYGSDDPGHSDRLRRETIELGGSRSPSRAVFGVLGAGNFAARTLVPLLKDKGVGLRTIVTSRGVSGTEVGEKFGFARSTTDPEQLFGDDAIDAVLVSTRHDSHSGYVVRALESGRAVFVEKPLAVTTEQLDAVRAAVEAASSPLITVGFNRRFAPLTVKMRQLVRVVPEPKAFVMTVNAGVIPPDHWVHDPVAGGGRIVGEGCHFIDLLRHLAGCPVASWTVETLGRGRGGGITEDKATITLRFEDGSMGTVHYLGNGHKSFPKERLEVFAAGGILVLDNFRSLVGFGWPGFRKMKLRTQDKGHSACLGAFVDAVRAGSDAPIPWAELDEVSRLSIEIADAARTRP